MFGTQNTFVFRNDVLNGDSALGPAHKKIYFIHSMALMHTTKYLQ